jgi:uncharacterized protein (DUF736 family)
MDDKELKGSLFVDRDVEVVKKGTIQINGKKKYVSLLKCRSQNGDEIYEISISAGRVFVNNQKTNEKSPDMGGNITVDGVAYKFGGWNNIDKRGQTYLGCNLQEKNDSPF